MELEPERHCHVTGCSRCRHSTGGCARCRKPSFRPRSKPRQGYPPAPQPKSSSEAAPGSAAQRPRTKRPHHASETCTPSAQGLGAWGPADAAGPCADSEAKLHEAGRLRWTSDGSRDAGEAQDISVRIGPPPDDLQQPREPLLHTPDPAAQGDGNPGLASSSGPSASSCPAAHQRPTPKAVSAAVVGAGSAPTKRRQPLPEAEEEEDAGDVGAASKGHRRQETDVGGAGVASKEHRQQEFMRQLESRMLSHRGLTPPGRGVGRAEVCPSGSEGGRPATTPLASRGPVQREAQQNPPKKKRRLPAAREILLQASPSSQQEAGPLSSLVAGPPSLEAGPSSQQGAAPITPSAESAVTTVGKLHGYREVGPSQAGEELPTSSPLTPAVQVDPRACLWVPPPSPYCLIEEVVYDDPWRLLLTCMLLNKTSSKQVGQRLTDWIASGSAGWYIAVLDWGWGRGSGGMVLAACTSTAAHS